LKDATTLYVGNLSVSHPDAILAPSLISYSSFYTTEEQIHELFAK
jgi:nuclear cap-binding protein subunit 2